MRSDTADATRDAAREAEGDRPCARGEWCGAATRVLQDDGTTRREPARSYRTFCDLDCGTIARCISAAPAAYGRLSGALGDHVTREVIVRIPFGPSVPIRLDVDEIMRLTVDAVMFWHERTATAARLSEPDTGAWRAVSLGPYAGSLLDHSCRVLREHLTTLLGLEPEWMVRPSCSPAARTAYGAVTGQVIGDTTCALAGGAQAGNEFMRLDYLARAAMGETDPQVIRLLGVACRNCSRLALRMADPPQHEGDTAYYSTCMSCRHLLTESEFLTWAKRNARFWAGRLTPAQIAARSELGEPTARRLVDAVLNYQLGKFAILFDIDPGDGWHRPGARPNHSGRSSMRTVHLGGKKANGRLALVDDEDYELVSAHRWHVRDRGRLVYASTNAVRPTGGYAPLGMHVLITGWPLTDHIDHDGLNNQRYNLREATNRQNMWNSRPRAGTTSRYKGVTWYAGSSRWVARITVGGRVRVVGYFADEADAAHAYDWVAREAFAEFACLNFPDDLRWPAHHVDREHYRRRPDVADELIVRLRHDGWTFVAIADHVKMRRDSVSKRYSRATSRA